MIDLNKGSGWVFGGAPANMPRSVSDLVNTHIDRGLAASRNDEAPREYLGASRIGEECARKLAYEYLKVPGETFTGKTLRIFETGHRFEDMMAGWLRGAGFTLRTENARGGQFGFETMGGRVKGHIDGVLTEGPADLLVGTSHAFPGGWECKALNDRSWNDTVKKGVRVSKPVYFAQMQIYMGYLDLPWFLFTALNKNTQEIYHELVAFDPAEAQRLSDRAVDIIRTAESGNLPPRIGGHPDFFVCRWCGHRSVCWEL